MPPRSALSFNAPNAPKHERLRAHLLRQLEQGDLRPGDALPTEHELAAGAGVSRNTVRQALAALEFEGLIRRIPGRGTFIHGDALQRLSAGVDLFALVIPETRGGFYPSLQRGFHDASGSTNHQVIVSDTGNDHFRQADSLLQLMDKKVAGVAIVPTTDPLTPSYQIRPLQERGIPVVFCHRRVEGIRAPLISFSPVDVGRLAGRAIANYGHRRVAMFGPQRTTFSAQYEEGLRRGLAERGVPLPAEFVRWDSAPKMSTEHEQFIERHLRELFSSRQAPTAIFCSFDSEAELVYVTLGRLGIEAPKDVSLVGWGGTWREGAIVRRLTSVVVDEETLGRTAVRLLDEMRNRDRPIEDSTELLMPLDLYQGDTLAAPASGEPRLRREAIDGIR
ncbi:MAG TPA: GntR family transcriptional regulator [Caulifigura sp.]|nr:GntR family transcriptional regulator [Caulifigura sp.]